MALKSVMEQSGQSQALKEFAASPQNSREQLVQARWTFDPAAQLSAQLAQLVRSIELIVQI